jgi:sugar phosphate isomerase/epimerase
MPAPLALQLYTVREALNSDFNGIVTKVAQMGYAGVESAGFPGTTPVKAKALFDDLGLQVCSAHTRLPNADGINEVVDLAGALGVTRVVTSSGRDRFQDMASVEALCAEWNEAAGRAGEHGLELGLHNHWWEFTQVEGRSGYDLLIEKLDPSIHFQVDTYWVQTGGGDAVDVISRLGTRAPLIHIKDGPCDPQANMLAAGSGAMDFSAIAKACGTAAEWFIIELDRCDTDMMEAVRQSHDYMVGNGLATGRE